MHHDRKNKTNKRNFNKMAYVLLLLFTAQLKITVSYCNVL